MRRLFIVRHGNTFAPEEVPRRIGVRSDLPLAPSGKQQAGVLGRMFQRRGIRFARVMAGRLQRTRETAALILADLPDAPTIETADWLTEIDHGPDEGQPEAAVLARLGETALGAWNDDAVPPNGWTVDVQARLDGWRALFDAAVAGDTLLVTSNGAARFALLADRDLSAHRPLKLRTGAFGEIAQAPDGRLTLVNWDCRPDPAPLAAAVAASRPEA